MSHELASASRSLPSSFASCDPLFPFHAIPSCEKSASFTRHQEGCNARLRSSLHCLLGHSLLKTLRSLAGHRSVGSRADRQCISLFRSLLIQLLDPIPLSACLSLKWDSRVHHVDTDIDTSSFQIMTHTSRTVSMPRFVQRTLAHVVLAW